VFIRTRQQVNGQEGDDKDISEVVGVEESRKPKPEIRRKTEIRSPKVAWPGGVAGSVGRMGRKGCTREQCRGFAIPAPCQWRGARVENAEGRMGARSKSAGADIGVNCGAGVKAQTRLRLMVSGRKPLILENNDANGYYLTRCAEEEMNRAMSNRSHRHPWPTPATAARPTGKSLCYDSPGLVQRSCIFPVPSSFLTPNSDPLAADALPSNAWGSPYPSAFGLRRMRSRSDSGNDLLDREDLFA
jgi:hypothetical protein